MTFSTHELLWICRNRHSELRSTRGLLIGAAVHMGGSWQCVLLGSVIAVRPDEDSARQAITDALTILEAQQLLPCMPRNTFQLANEGPDAGTTADRSVARLVAEVADERSRELRLQELRIESFMKRTGLSNNEITLVHYRDKCFPQWSGAIPWKKAEKWRSRPAHLEGPTA